jgi:hypothetical protein
MNANANAKRKSAAAAGPQGDKSAKKEEGCHMVEKGTVVVKDEFKTPSKYAADG